MKLPWSHQDNTAKVSQQTLQEGIKTINDTLPLSLVERNKEDILAEADVQASEIEAGEEARQQGKDKNQKKPLKNLIAELHKAGEEGCLVLRTEDLVKKYRQRTVANHVSINVRQGEIVGLLGPNGAGKTTTFYMTTGLVTPNEGRVFLNDMEITKLPVYKRAKLGIGYLPQEASVFRNLTVENNLKLVLEMTKTSPEYQRDKLEELIAEFHLEKVRKNLGNRLSGGERRRCEIARCLAINPRFIMLDEPFAGVDPIAVEDIQSIVYRLKSKNIGILITDHNAPETLSITDRAYLLFEGKILFQGSSEELAENPVVREKYLGRNFIFRRKDFGD